MGCLTSVDFEASGWSLAGSRAGLASGFFCGVRSRGSFAGLVRSWAGLVRGSRSPGARSGLSLGCLTFSMAFRLSVRVACFPEAGARCVMVALLSLLA